MYYKKQELVSLYNHLLSSLIFGGSVLLVFLVFCVVFYMLFVFVLCLVSNAVCVSGLSIVDCHFGFLLSFIQIT